MSDSPPRIDAATLGRLRWRCRRGLLENDLLIERFFARYGDRLDAPQAEALAGLMDLADNDLLDLLLSRTEPSGTLDTAEVRALLAKMRPPPHAPAPASSRTPRPET